MSEMKIEKGVPIPQGWSRGAGNSGKYKYPFREMEIGDSVPIKLKKRSIKMSVYQAIYRASKETGRKFTGRKDGEILRVWRTE